MSNTFRTYVRYFAAVHFLLILPFLLSAQEVIDTAQYRAVYEFSYKTKPDQTEFAKEDLMYLDIGQKASKFYSRYEQIRDSILADGLDKKLSIYEINDIRRSYKKGIKEVCYKQLDKNLLIVTDRLIASPYLYEEPLLLLNWKIEQEMKEVVGYMCQKATTTFGGREWTVYFAPEVPLQQGPWKLWGLPGLITEAFDSDNFFLFRLKGFEKLEPSTDIVFTHTTYSNKEYEKIRKKDFLKNKIFSNKNPFEFMNVVQGIKSTMSDDAKQKTAKLTAAGGIPYISLGLE